MTLPEAQKILEEAVKPNTDHTKIAVTIKQIIEAAKIVGREEGRQEAFKNLLPTTHEQ